MADCHCRPVGKKYYLNRQRPFTLSSAWIISAGPNGVLETRDKQTIAGDDMRVILKIISPSHIQEKLIVEHIVADKCAYAGRSLPWFVIKHFTESKGNRYGVRLFVSHPSFPVPLFVSSNNLCRRYSLYPVTFSDWRIECSGKWRLHQ